MNVTVPYRFTPRPYQLPVLKAFDAGIKRGVWVAHRRSGKDKTAWNLMIKKALERVGVYYYFAPTYSQGKKIIWDNIDKDEFKMLDHIPKEIIKKKNETELKIELINGSIIQIVGTDKIDSVVGTNPVGCVFTEYSLQNPKAWDYIRPILAENGGWALFVYTPRGMNHGWKILQQAKELETWFWEVLTIDDTKAIGEEELDEEQSQMPQDLFEQEYYCKFLEGAGQFFKGIDRNTYEGRLNPQENKRYQLGVDLAKYQDWTVIAPFDLTTFKIGTLERFNQIDWNLQKAKIEANYLRYNKAKVILDRTGVGDPICDDLTNSKVNVDPYIFTEQTRRDLLINLQVLLEQDRIKIPNDENLIAELKSFRYELSDRGKVRISVPEGMHDDTVMAVALAVWQIPQNPIKVVTSEERELLKQFDSRRKQGKGYFTGLRHL